MRWLLFLLLSCSPQVEPASDAPVGASADAEGAGERATEGAADGAAEAPAAPIRSAHLEPDGSPTFTNRLSGEASPYLLQHAHNPVDWYPWGEEAFDKARAEDKPILLSVGYSTCHWCHVMERESFEDLAIATFLNQHFVAIKVDREERPDVDAVYMEVTRALTGRGGWPMTVVMTPEREPFFAGTYFPARTGDRGTRPGFQSILLDLATKWRDERDALVTDAKKLTARLSQSQRGQRGARPGIEAFVAGARAIASNHDREFGGFGERKKFPQPARLELLLRYHRRTKDVLALEAVTRTLDAMADGGLHDPIAGGFHRYTVERRWRVPHFEKMLYDNAWLASVYLQAWQVTGEARYADVVRSTLSWIDGDMSDPRGGFHSATDADSPGPDGHGEEGRYFTWTPAEVRQALGPEATPLVLAAWGITTRGAQAGRSILRVAVDRDQLAADRGMTREEVDAALAAAAAQMLAVRATRAPPITDDQVLAAWNGLAISAFAQAGRALGDPALVQRAARAAEFVLRSMRVGGRLHRTWRGRVGPRAVLDDHAFVIAGLLDLFEASAERRWLDEAIALDRVVAAQFEDPAGAWFDTADDAEELLVRRKAIRDGAVPSGNGVQVRNVLRLAELTGDAAHRTRAERALEAFGGALARRPSTSPGLLGALDWLDEGPMELVVVSPGDGGAALRQVASRAYLPNASRLLLGEGASTGVPWAEGKAARDGATAWVCFEGLCKAPTTDVDVLRGQLAEAVRLEAAALTVPARKARVPPPESNTAPHEVGSPPRPGDPR